MASSLTDGTWKQLPAYIRAADDSLADPHTRAGFLRRWLGAITAQADTSMDAVTALDPITNPTKKSAARDATTAPAALLPWLALLAGLMPDYADLPTDRLREVLVRPPGWRRRGSTKAMAASVASTLTGTQTVIVDKHVGGDMWRMRVSVVEGEMPDPDATRVAILREKPAGVIDVQLLTTAAPHTHTIGSLAGRGGNHRHTIAQLASRGIGHGHTIGNLVGRT